MKRKEHEQKSIIMFGKPWTEVHAFLDQYFAIFGPRHRIILHHRRGIDLLIQEIPGPVRKVAEQHIIDDLDEIPENWDWLYYDLDMQYADRYRIKHGHKDHDCLGDTLKKLYGVEHRI